MKELKRTPEIHGRDTREQRQKEAEEEGSVSRFLCNNIETMISTKNASLYCLPTIRSLILLIRGKFEQSRC